MNTYELTHHLHGLPLWFLVLSLFLPRVALFIGWLGTWHFPLVQPWAAVVWVALPRILVLMMISAHQGFSLWFWVHLVVAILVWTGAFAKGNSVRSSR